MLLSLTKRAHGWNQISPQEQQALVQAFQDPSAAQASGVHVAGQKYFTLQANPRSIYGKKQVRVYGSKRSFTT